VQIGWFPQQPLRISVDVNRVKCLKCPRKYLQPILVVIRSKDVAYSSLTAGIAGLNPTEGTDVVSRLLCTVQVSAFGTN